LVTSFFSTGCVRISGWRRTCDSVGTNILSAEDDPGERFSVGQLDPGFVTLTLDLTNQDMIATRIVGNVPQRITVMAIRDLNGDGDVEDSGEKTTLFDAGAPVGTDIRAVKLKY
jgi:hypothetical protein